MHACMLSVYTPQANHVNERLHALFFFGPLDILNAFSSSSRNKEDEISRERFLLSSHLLLFLLFFFLSITDNNTCHIPVVYGVCRCWSFHEEGRGRRLKCKERKKREKRRSSASKKSDDRSYTLTERERERVRLKAELQIDNNRQIEKINREIQIDTQIGG